MSQNSFTNIQESPFGKLLTEIKKLLKKVQESSQDLPDANKKAEKLFTLITSVINDIENKILPPLNQGKTPSLMEKATLYIATKKLKQRINGHFGLREENAAESSDELFITAFINSFLNIINYVEVADPLTFELLETILAKIELLPANLKDTVTFLNPEALKVNLTGVLANTALIAISAAGYKINPFQLSLTNEASFEYDFTKNGQLSATPINLNDLYQENKERVREALKEKIEYYQALCSLEDEKNALKEKINEFENDCRPELEWVLDDTVTIDSCTERLEQIKNLLTRDIELLPSIDLSKVPATIIIKNENDVFETKNTGKQREQIEQTITEQEERMSGIKAELGKKLKAISAKHKELVAQSLNVESIEKSKNILIEKLNLLQARQNQLKKPVIILEDIQKRLPQEERNLLEQKIEHVLRAEEEISKNWQGYKDLCTLLPIQNVSTLNSTLSVKNLRTKEGVEGALTEVNNMTPNGINKHEKTSILTKIKKSLRTLNKEESIDDILFKISQKEVFENYAAKLNKTIDHEEWKAVDNELAATKLQIKSYKAIIPLMEQLKALFDKLDSIETLKEQLIDTPSFPFIHELKTDIESLKTEFDSNKKKLSALCNKVEDASNLEEVSSLSDNIDELNTAIICFEQKMADNFKHAINEQLKCIENLKFDSNTEERVKNNTDIINNADALIQSIADVDHAYLAPVRALQRNLNDKKVLNNNLNRQVSTFIKIADEYGPKLDKLCNRSNEVFIKELKNKLNNLKETGESKDLLRFIKEHRDSFPGLPLQSSLNRLIIELWQFDPAKNQPISQEWCVPYILGQINRDNKYFVQGIRKLFTQINQLSIYSKTLPVEQQQTVNKLADALSHNLCAFILNSNETVPDQKRFEDFKADFKCLLHSQDDMMSKHETSWRQFKFICINILAAVTTLGIAVGAQLTISKIQTGRATFFYDKSARLEKAGKIENELNHLGTTAAQAGSVSAP